MEQIQIHCEAEKIALAMIGSDSAGVCIIMFGDAERLDANSASLVGAHLLIEGVLSGTFSRENSELLDQQNKSIPKEELN